MEGAPKAGGGSTAPLPLSTAVCDVYFSPSCQDDSAHGFCVRKADRRSEVRHLGGRRQPADAGLSSSSFLVDPLNRADFVAKPSLAVGSFGGESVLAWVRFGFVFEGKPRFR